MANFKKNRGHPIQIVDGLDYLHQKKIIHRDLKCENILLGASNRCLIADFGFARILKSDEMSETYCGSAAYAAPELLRGVKYNSFGSDIWSIGCILFVMLCHRMPFRDDTVATIVREQVTFWRPKLFFQTTSFISF